MISYISVLNFVTAMPVISATVAIVVVGLLGFAVYTAYTAWKTAQDKKVLAAREDIASKPVKSTPPQSPTSTRPATPVVNPLDVAIDAIERAFDAIFAQTGTDIDINIGPATAGVKAAHELKGAANAASSDVNVVETLNVAIDAINDVLAAVMSVKEVDSSVNDLVGAAAAAVSVVVDDISSGYGHKR